MKLTYNKKEETWRQRYIHLTTIGSPYKAVRLGLVYCLEHLAARKRLLGPRAITMSVGKADILKWLSKHGPEVYVDEKTFGEFLPRCSYRLFKVIYKGSPDPLLYTYYAIKSENLELLKWFVEQGHLINEDLLWWACRYGNIEIIEWLQTQLS